MRKSSIIDLMQRILSIIPHSEHCLRYQQYDRNGGNKYPKCRCNRHVIDKDLKYWASIDTEQKEINIPDIGQCSWCGERLYIIDNGKVIEPHNTISYDNEEGPCPGQMKPPKS